jgi:hypothetical protein
MLATRRLGYRSKTPERTRWPRGEADREVVIATVNGGLDALAVDDELGVAGSYGAQVEAQRQADVLGGGPEGLTGALALVMARGGAGGDHGAFEAQPGDVLEVGDAGGYVIGFQQDVPMPLSLPGKGLQKSASHWL